MKDTKRGRPSASFVVGSVALIFLIIGYQAALFITKASVARIVANHDHPDTVYVFMPLESEAGSASPDSSHRSAPPISRRDCEDKSSPSLHRSGPLPLTSRGWLRSGLGRPSSDSRANNMSDSRWVEPTELAADGRSSARNYGKAARDIWRANTRRRYENFRFDPNTVSVDDLMRLGFSQRQAEAIDNYRKKGGRFRRKTDFARSYVVEDSVYKRLERFIDIPKIDINRADSAAFETLPGIGKFFAAKMVSYRKELGGYSFPEQLMDIWHFDQEKFDGLKDLITVGPYEPYPLWTLPESELAKHPYIGERAAHGIIIFRDNSPEEDWTIVNLRKAGILEEEKGFKLSRCRIADVIK